MGTTQLRKEGFTLIELLVVIAIIVILASWIIGNLIHARRRGENERCNATIAILTTGLNRYKETYGTYPPKSKIPVEFTPAKRNNLLLRELLITNTYQERGGRIGRTPPSLNDVQDIQLYLGDSDGDWDRTQPYLDKDDVLVDGVEILDPWGNPYYFKIPGDTHVGFNDPDLGRATSNVATYDLWSIGRNGISEPDGNNLEETDDWTNWFQKPQNAD